MSGPFVRYALAKAVKKARPARGLPSSLAGSPPQLGLLCDPFLRPDASLPPHPLSQGEDCCVGLPQQVWPEGPWAAGPRTYGLYAVADGHNGPACAEFFVARLAARFAAELAQALPACGGGREAAVLAALGGTLGSLDAEFCARGELGGCTATVVVQSGWHLSVACVGDSRAVLDTGVEARAALLLPFQPLSMWTPLLTPRPGAAAHLRLPPG